MKFDIAVSHRAPLSASNFLSGHAQDSNTKAGHRMNGQLSPIAQIPTMSGSTIRRLSARGRRHILRHSAFRERKTSRAAGYAMRLWFFRSGEADASRNAADWQQFQKRLPPGQRMAQGGSC